jgi:hypothetical protein
MDAHAPAAAASPRRDASLPQDEVILFSHPGDASSLYVQNIHQAVTPRGRPG